MLKMGSVGNYFTRHCQLTSKIPVLGFLCLCFTATISLCMVQSPQPLTASWNTLPADVRRYAIQFIACSNVYEVAETMKMLNATDRFCHAAIQSEPVVMSIMKRMPYIENRISLLLRLRKWPVCKRFDTYKKVLQAKLRNRKELLDATKLKKIESVKVLLFQKNLGFSCWDDPNGLIYVLDFALKRGNAYKEIAVDLIKAGANIDSIKLLYNMYLDGGSALWHAVEQSDISLVKLLLEYGADPNSFNLKIPVGSPEIRKIIHDAQEKKKERMRLLCVNRTGCAIS